MTAATANRIPPVEQADDGVSSLKGRIHTIDIASLVIHKYPEQGALLKKADKISRELIHAELREGEYLRVNRPGCYQLVLPKLLPEAGALRTSVITEQLFRAITELNPAKKNMDEKMAAPPPAEPAVRPKNFAKMPPAPPRPRLVNPRAIPSEDELRRAASQAVQLMSSSITTKAEELFSLPAGRDLLANTSPRFQPVWNHRKGVLSAYRVRLLQDGDEIAANQITKTYGLESVDAANALIDAVKYRAACTSLTQLWAAGEQAVIIVPVCFSTIDHSRYIGAYLDAGAHPVGPSLKDRLVFEIVNVPGNVSRYRLREAVAYLRGRCRGINICLGADWMAAEFADFREFGIHMAGLDAGAFVLGEQKLMKTIDDFAAKCDYAGLTSFCANLTSFSTLSAAIAAGISYVSGSALAPSLPTPRGIAPLDLPRLVGLSARRWTEGAAPRAAVS
jgi:hypothetical protein